VDIALADDLDGRAARAARTAVSEAGIELHDGARRANSSAWWRAGVEEALDSTTAETGAARYDAMRSPRKTRGATRA
jgi:hypothetical protein